LAIYPAASYRFAKEVSSLAFAHFSGAGADAKGENPNIS
jgi:hypothetical protein